MATRCRWAAGQLDAPLADDGVVAVGKACDELVAVRDAADLLDLLERRMRIREAQVGPDAAVEEEVLLQDDAEPRAVVPEADGLQIPPVEKDAPGRRPVERHDEADQRALAGPARSDQSRRGAGRGRSRKPPFSTGTSGSYSNQTPSSRTSPCSEPRPSRASSLLVLGRHLHDLANSVEAGERFGDLGPDRRDLDDRRYDDAGEDDVLEQLADGPCTVHQIAAAQHDHQRADDSHDQRRHRGDGRDAGHGPWRRFRNKRCAPFANTSCSRFSTPYAFTTRMPPSVSVSPTGHLRVDLPPLPEDRAQFPRS